MQTGARRGMNSNKVLILLRDRLCQKCDVVTAPDQQYLATVATDVSSRPIRA